MTTPKQVFICTPKICDKKVSHRVCGHLNFTPICDVLNILLNFPLDSRTCLQGFAPIQQ